MLGLFCSLVNCCTNPFLLEFEMKKEGIRVSLAKHSEENKIERFSHTCVSFHLSNTLNQMRQQIYRNTPLNPVNLAKNFLTLRGFLIFQLCTERIKSINSTLSTFSCKIIEDARNFLGHPDEWRKILWRKNKLNFFSRTINLRMVQTF